METNSQFLSESESEQKEGIMSDEQTVTVPELTESELQALMDRYGLRAAPKKTEGEPSFQVIRGHAIRAAAKSVAKAQNVKQAAVHISDTHKVSGKYPDTIVYDILLKCSGKAYEVQVKVSGKDLKSVVTSTVPSTKSRF